MNYQITYAEIPQKKKAGEFLKFMFCRAKIFYFVDLLKNGSTIDKFQAAEALAKIGEPAVLYLIPALRLKQPSVRKLTALTLKRIKDRRAVRALRESLNDELDEEVRMALKAALCDIINENYA